MVNTKCPYCGKNISYVGTLIMRRKGEYYCKRCKKESNVHINKTILILFFFTVAFSVMALLYYLLLTDRENLWFMLIVAVPYFIFYLCTPLFIRLKPKKKFQDSLYDTQMVEADADPDPTMATTSKVVPAFVDDIVLGDEEYKPAIDADVFAAIKEERKAVSDTDGGTKSFDRFENISSGAAEGHTVPVGDLKDIPVRESSAAEVSEEPEKAEFRYDLSNFE